MAYDKSLEETDLDTKTKKALKKLNSDFLNVSCALTMAEYGLKQRNSALYTAIVNFSGGKFAKIDRRDLDKKRSLYPEILLVLGRIIEEFDHTTNPNRFTKEPVTKDTLKILYRQIEQNLT